MLLLDVSEATDERIDALLWDRVKQATNDLCADLTGHVDGVDPDVHAFLSSLNPDRIIDADDLLRPTLDQEFSAVIVAIDDVIAEWFWSHLYVPSMRRYHHTLNRRVRGLASLRTPRRKMPLGMVCAEFACMSIMPFGQGEGDEAAEHRSKGRCFVMFSCWQGRDRSSIADMWRSFFGCTSVERRELGGMLKSYQVLPPKPEAEPCPISECQSSE